MRKRYDVIVVGAGLSGCHAAAAASGAGATVLLLTNSWDTVAALGRGPAIYLDEVRGLPRPYGPARRHLKKAIFWEGVVRGKQIALLEKERYQRSWKHWLEKESRVRCYQDGCETIAKTSGGWTAGTTWGNCFVGRCMIVAPGVFVGAGMTVRGAELEGARPGETAALGLGKALGGLGVELEARETVMPPVIKWRTCPPAVTAERTYGRRPVELDIGQKGAAVILLPESERGEEAYAMGPEEWVSAMPGVETIQPAFKTTYWAIKGSQLNRWGAVRGQKDLYCAGGFAGGNTYGESIVSGLRAGQAAAKVSRGT